MQCPPPGTQFISRHLWLGDGRGSAAAIDRKDMHRGGWGGEGGGRWVGGGGGGRVERVRGEIVRGGVRF